MGWVVGLALAARGLWAALRGEDAHAPDLLLAGFAVPYWLAWWLKFSFDARFLLLVLPIMAVWAGRVVAWLLAALRDSFPVPRRGAQILGALLLAMLLYLGTADRLGGAYRLLTARDLTDMERLALAKGPLADLVTYARENLDPNADCLYLMDERLPYFLHDFRYRVGYPQTLAELEGCDYVFHVSSIHTVYNNPIGWDRGDFYQYAFNPAVFEPVFESGGVQVMRILRTSPPEGE